MPDKRQETRRVKLGELTVDPRLQMRATIDAEHVARLAEAVRGKQKLPPGRAYDDGDGTLWLSRGFHRFHAHQAAGAEQMEVEIARGDRRAALADAMADNAEHLALPRSNADKRRAVTTALADAEWTKLPDREIAKRCAVSHTFVATIRAELDSAAGRKAAATGSPAAAAAGNVATPVMPETAQPVGNVASQNPLPGAAVAVSGGNVASSPATPAASAGRETEPQPPPPVKTELLKDRTGAPVPERLLEVFKGRGEFLDITGELNALKKRTLAMMNSPHGAYLDEQEIEDRFKDVRMMLGHSASPYAVCRLCGGRRGGCKACDKQGWMTEQRYAVVPADLKDPTSPDGKGRAA
jgi:hypothetical protein